MAKKKGKSKVSSIKRSNQLQNKLKKQGKLNKKRNRKKIKVHAKPVVRHNKEKELNSEEEEELKRVEEEQVENLAHFNKTSFSFLARAALEREARPGRRRKRRLLEENKLSNIEKSYEESIDRQSVKKMKYLLPIKTKEGIVTRAMEEENDEEEEVETDDETGNKEKVEEAKVEPEGKEYSSADLLARRENALKIHKFRIGVLCSGLLENPEIKIKNFIPLLEMLTETDLEVCITVKKLALISLLEIFKDLLPEYQIKIHDDPKVKLKKQVKLLRDYESELLRHYKTYLQKIESIISVLKRKRGSPPVSEPEMNLAIMALKCLCELLISYPYFNYSKNITHLIVPFLNSSVEKVRNVVASSIRNIFRTDKRGEVSLYIVRNINKLVKTKNNAVNPDTILVFLSLKLKDVNLDKEREDELEKKKLNAKKHNILKLSKREKKRKKRLQDLEKELLETKASENQEKKQQYMTEITKLVFMIYFKILKFSPNSKLLKAALEGLSKFAHCINIEFYHDLVNIINHLIETENLGFKEKLCCVHTVFTILFYQGATIYLDPTRFYTHLYANIVHLNAGKTHSDLPLVLKAADVVLLKRRKYISLQRLLAFTKRLSLLSLQVLPNGALALLNVMKEILQVNSSTDVLLDTDSSIGQGVYNPEMDEPEYCNAGVSTLWELTALQRHYHPTVQEYAKVISGINHVDKSSQFKNFLKQNAEELFRDYDASEVKFNPPVPPPSKFPKKKRKREAIKGFLNDDLQDYVSQTLTRNGINMNINCAA